MKDKESGIGLNWNYVIISTVVISILTILVLYMPNLREIDTNILQAVRHALSPYPAYIALFISEFGRQSNMLWPQIAAVSVLVSHKYYIKAFLLVFFTQASYFLNDLLKNFVCRERPESCSYNGFSFPSCHASTTMCFLGIIIYLISTHTRNNFWRNFFVILFGLWIVLVGISRLWLGVHFPVDIIAGMFLGFLLVNLYIIVLRALTR